MIVDLLGRDAPSDVEADVHVIGAGIAGLLAATRLAKAGLRVVVTESGGEKQVEETHPLNEVVHRRSIYSGAEHGRFRCLGGTSTRWGGAMIPFLASDMLGQGERHWPLSLQDLTAYQDDVERLFQLPTGPFDDPDMMQCRDGSSAAFLARLAKWPPFVRRNVARLFEVDLASPVGPQVWLNATVTGFSLTENGRISSALAKAPDHTGLTVRATETIIAAGAIESTRLLLLMDRAEGGRLFAGADVLGRYFHDHLSVRIGMLHPTDPVAVNRVAGFRFEQGGMRNLRFEPCEDLTVRRTIPAGFAHFVIAGQEGSGFDLLRDVYRHLQKRSVPSLKTLAGLATALPWLVRAGWWHQREHRLLFPPNANIEVHLVIEQVPRAANRITLSTDRVDRYDQPLAVIDWAVDDEDERNLLASARLFVDTWNESTLAGLGTITRRESLDALRDLTLGGGIYHPGGSTKMATRAAEGVVDRDLRTFAISNLSILSTSTFPSGGGANPTMMLMMASLRSADGIIRTLRSRSSTPTAGDTEKVIAS